MEVGVSQVDRFCPRSESEADSLRGPLFAGWRTVQYHCKWKGEQPPIATAGGFQAHIDVKNYPIDININIGTGTKDHPWNQAHIGTM